MKTETKNCGDPTCLGCNPAAQAEAMQKAITQIRKTIDQEENEPETLLFFANGKSRRGEKIGGYDTMIAYGEPHKISAALVRQMIEDKELATIISAAVKTHSLLRSTGIADYFADLVAAADRVNKK